MFQSCHLCGFIMLKGNVFGVHVVCYSLFTLRKKRSENALWWLWWCVNVRTLKCQTTGCNRMDNSNYKKEAIIWIMYEQKPVDIGHQQFDKPIKTSPNLFFSVHFMWIARDVKMCACDSSTNSSTNGDGVADRRIIIMETHRQFDIPYTVKKRCIPFFFYLSFLFLFH